MRDKEVSGKEKKEVCRGERRDLGRRRKRERRERRGRERMRQGEGRPPLNGLPKLMEVKVVKGQGGTTWVRNKGAKE